MIKKFWLSLAFLIFSPSFILAKEKSLNNEILLVDYDIPIEQLVNIGYPESTRYLLVSENFLTGRTGKKNIEIRIFSTQELFGKFRSATPREVLKVLDKRGYRPAELLELLTFGIKHHNEQWKYPIVAFGSILGNDYERITPHIWGSAGKRVVLFRDLHEKRYKYCRFAAVKL